MAKKGLVRMPYYPQLSCLRDVHEHAPLVMSALLFWMSRAKDPTYCPKRHNYQMALHMGISHDEYCESFQALEKLAIFSTHEFTIEPKEKTEDSKVTIETRYGLDMVRLQEVLAERGVDLSLKLIAHAADDSFDFYDVVEEKFLPTTQSLLGFVSSSDYEHAALTISRFIVYVNEFHEDLAYSAIAPGWKLLLAVPMGSFWEDYAKELTIRFLRAGERAIDFSFSDGNFFVPDFTEIKAKLHIVKHFGSKEAPRTLSSAMMMLLAITCDNKFTFVSELSVKELQAALSLLHDFDPHLDLSKALSDDYYKSRKLTKAQQEAEGHLFASVVAKLKDLPSSTAEAQEAARAEAKLAKEEQGQA